jgi:hypothetical protein
MEQALKMVVSRGGGRECAGEALGLGGREAVTAGCALVTAQSGGDARIYEERR